jgi:hypothetical protein
MRLTILSNIAFIESIPLFRFTTTPGSTKFSQKTGGSFNDRSLSPGDISYLWPTFSMLTRMEHKFRRRHAFQSLEVATKMRRLLEP